MSREGTVDRVREADTGPRVCSHVCMVGELTAMVMSDGMDPIYMRSERSSNGASNRFGRLALDQRHQYPFH